MDIGPDFFLDILCLAIFSQTADSKKIVAKALELYNAESAENSMMNDGATKLYMGILREMVSSDLDVDSPSDVAALMMKFKHNPLADKDPNLIKTIESVFTNRKDVPQRRVQAIQKKVRTWLVWAASNARLRKAFAINNKIAQTTDPIKQDALLNQMADHGREFVKTFDETSIDAGSSNLGFIDLSCPNSVAKTIEQHANKKRGGVLKMGWQGFNKAMGVAGGITIGESCGFAASSHNYKSGILMDILRWTVTLNDAPRKDDRTPCVVFISLENELDENMMNWFKSAYANMFNRPPSGDMSHQDIINFVVDVFSRRGWKVFVYREMGETFGYPEWVKLHADLASNGFNVVMSVLDYITLMNMGEGEGTSASKAQQMANRISNYGRHNNFAFCTGLQLNTDAQILESSGQINIVKRYGASHLADSKGYKREFDVLFFLYIQKNHLGRSYLTMRLDKHRYEHHTPEADKSFAYLFPDAGTKMPILDDINEPISRAVYDIYADGTADSNEIASF